MVFTVDDAVSIAVHRGRLEDEAEHRAQIGGLDPHRRRDAAPRDLPRAPRARRTARRGRGAGECAARERRAAAAERTAALPPASGARRRRRSDHRILFAARSARDRDESDVTLVSTPMEAFGHVVERPVDLLLVSATMRGDSGEPFYRVLWRLAPALKGRSVLVTSAAGEPASSSRHVVERPLTRDVVARIVQSFARDDKDPG